VVTHQNILEFGHGNTPISRHSQNYINPLTSILQISSPASLPADSKAGSILSS